MACATASSLRIDGGLRTGRDLLMAALLGAEEFGFGTAAARRDRLRHGPPVPPRHLSHRHRHAARGPAREVHRHARGGSTLLHDRSPRMCAASSPRSGRGRWREVVGEAARFLRRAARTADARSRRPSWRRPPGPPPAVAASRATTLGRAVSRAPASATERVRRGWHRRRRVAEPGPDRADHGRPLGRRRRWPERSARRRIAGAVALAASAAPPVRASAPSPARRHARADRPGQRLRRQGPLRRNARASDPNPIWRRRRGGARRSPATPACTGRPVDALHLVGRAGMRFAVRNSRRRGRRGGGRRARLRVHDRRRGRRPRAGRGELRRGHDRWPRVPARPVGPAGGASRRAA